MSRIVMTDPVPPRPVHEEPTLLDFAAVLLRQWKVLLGTALVVVALTGAYALTRPRVYTTRLVLVPSAAPDANSRAQLLAAQIPGLMRLAGSSSNPGQALVQAILRSGALQDSLQKSVVGTPSGRTAGAREIRRVLADGMEISTDPADRSVRVAITSHSPVLSAELGREVPGAVNTIAAGLAMEAQLRRRETLQRQLDLSRQRLSRSEELVRQFEERHRTPSLPDQARSTIEAAAELQRAIGMAEIQVARLARTSTPENPQYRAAVSELQNLRAQLSRLGSGSGDMLINTGMVPEMKMELTRLTRQFRADEQVYLALVAELMGTESSPADLTVVSVLDAPALPDQPSGPRVKLLLLLGGMLGGVMGLFAAFVVDYLNRARRSRDHEDFFLEWDRLRGRPPVRVGSANGHD